ncbi:MAG: SDR family NAD(P)-dependent oxidoreductase, partial [Acidobacteria bacterium]|nr:SDR family NAD(P)-dependent oxidoreductase [Acidobacteriota bacterium]
MNHDYANLTAIITGGASGIGLATAQLLHQRGARVAIVDLQADKGAEALNSLNNSNRAIFIQANLAIPEEADRVVAETVKAFGQ